LKKNTGANPPQNKIRMDDDNFSSVGTMNSIDPVSYTTDSDVCKKVDMFVDSYASQSEQGEASVKATADGLISGPLWRVCGSEEHVLMRTPSRRRMDTDDWRHRGTQTPMPVYYLFERHVLVI